MKKRYLTLALGLLLCAAGFGGWVYQIMKGLAVTNLSNSFSWGLYMGTFEFFIGAASGGIGIGLTYLLCIPINAIIHYLTGIPNLSAYLPGEVAAVLVVISIFLSVFAGFIPSRSAAKKDPLVALRTE